MEILHMLAEMAAFLFQTFIFYLRDVIAISACLCLPCILSESQGTGFWIETKESLAI